MDSAADDVPRCTLGPPTAPSTCYCTNRPGCPYDGGDDCLYCGEPDCHGECDDLGPDDDGPTVETTTAFQEAGLL